MPRPANRDELKNPPQRSTPQSAKGADETTMNPKPVSVEDVLRFAEAWISENGDKPQGSKLRKHLAKARSRAVFDKRTCPIIDESDAGVVNFLTSIPDDGEWGDVYLSIGKPEASSKSRTKPKPQPVIIPQSEPAREDIDPRESLGAKCLRFQDLAGWIDLKLRTRPPEKVLWDDCVQWLRQEPRIKAMQPDELMIVLSVVKGFIHAS